MVTVLVSVNFEDCIREMTRNLKVAATGLGWMLTSNRNPLCPPQIKRGAEGIVIVVYLTGMVVFRVVARRVAMMLMRLLSIVIESPPQFPPAALVSLV